MSGSRKPLTEEQKQRKNQLAREKRAKLRGMAADSKNNKELESLNQEKPIYVVLGHTVDQKDSVVVYAGFDEEMAQKFSDMGDNMTYYTQLEVWTDQKGRVQ